ncbi:unnamed protein product [Polarella glacialis]|uniref:Uncharacterized protein n=1 Tax=Polarella glacialis TaxID=89957 RepID=A0A813KN30_POLGL|nr:unnamed protein product [Polarella glacialis]
MRPIGDTMGRASLHVNRWLAPFLPWYPLLFDFRRNLFDLTDKLLETQGVFPTTLPPARKAAGLHASVVIDLASAGRLRQDVTDYLVRLLALYYGLVLAFFSLGDGGNCKEGGGVHLIMRHNSSVQDVPTVYGVHTEVHGVRHSPGNVGFDCPAIKVLDSERLRWRAAVKPGQGIVAVSREAASFFRPVYSLEWHRALLHGLDLEAEHDVLSEQIAAEAT